MRGLLLAVPSLAFVARPRLIAPSSTRRFLGVCSGGATRSRLFSSVSNDDDDVVMPPVTLLSGFLGAGKTTMLSGILKNRAGLRVAVVVNDVASVNIDSDIIKREMRNEAGDSKEPIELLELQNGCVCCGPQAGELASAVKNLARIGEERGSPFDHVVIEMSGVADPSVVRFNLGDGGVDVARVVTLVDAPAFAEQWMSWDVLEERVDFAAKDAAYHEAPPKRAPLATVEEIEADPCSAQRKVVTLLLAQVEAADVLALNKMDMATPKQANNAARALTALCPDATLLKTTKGQASLLELLPPTGRSIVVEECADTACTDPTHDHDHSSSHAKEECADTACTDLTHDHSGSHDHGKEECADTACTDPTHDHSHSGSHAPAAPSAPADTTVDALGIDSLSYENQDRPFNYERLLELVRKWPIPQKEGLDLMDLRPGGAGVPGVTSPWESVLRSKGVVWVNSHPLNAVQWTFAGRHFALEDAGPWDGLGGPPTRTQMVVIGVALDQEQIKADLESCLVTDAELVVFEEKLKDLKEKSKPRFDIGTAVECNFGPDGWKLGTVVALDYRDPDWESSKPSAPYQVKLNQDGELIFAPYDDDVVIRASIGVETNP